jgi:uncharacterized membrane protein
MNEQENNKATEKETNRLEAFSDGVFAIAITLLILDIHVPEFTANETLMATLAHEWASILALLIGFFTILICWINHHYMYRYIHRSDSRLLLINGYKLLVVTITPFATALLSKHLQTEWRSSAISLYAFNFALMGLAMTAVWYYARAKGYIRMSSPAMMTAVSRLYLFSTLFPVAIWIVSFFNIIACLVLSGIMFAIYIFPENVVAWQTRSKE